MAALSIVIVGAGIGGLAAAVGLARNGHKVTVYERSESSGGVGFAFRITPNSDKCLRYLDIDAEAGGACAVSGGLLQDGQGNVFHETNENADQQKAKGTLSVFAYRPQIHQQLWDATIQSGAQLRAGVKVESVDAAKSTVTLEDGEVVSADLIIGADGLKSVVRPQVVDTLKYFPQCSTGHNAFRFMILKQKLLDDELLKPLYGKNGNYFFSWTAGDRRILAYPVDFGKQINFVCTHPEKMSDQQTDRENEEAQIEYNQKVSASTALKIYEDLDPRVTRVLELADPNGFRIWKLEDMDEIPQWGLNNTVLLGDACHPVLPYGFSGASMAIEDGLTLSTLLTADVTREQLQDRLKLYEEIRKPRVGKVRDYSRMIARDGFNDREALESYLPFLIKHDAVEYAKKTLADHEAGKTS